jgi:hypothetical protein
MRSSKEENKVDGRVTYGEIEIFLLENSGELFHNDSGKYGIAKVFVYRFTRLLKFIACQL